MGLITIGGILSHPQIFEAKKFKDKPESKPRFGCNIVIHKNDPQVDKIRAEVRSVEMKKWPKGMPKGYDVCCLKTFGENEDYMIFVAYAKEENRPDIMDRNGENIIDKSKAIAGSMAKMSAGVYAYDEGITAGLEGVMLLSEMGELGRLGRGKPDKKEMFGIIDPDKADEDTGERIDMTVKANGLSAESFRQHDPKWTDGMLVAEGYATWKKKDLPF